MSLLRKIGGMALLLLLPMGVMAQSSSVADTTLSVAERNALQGFNDTIDRLAPDFVEAYVSIAEPGDYLYTTLGHAAYHLKCPTFGLDYYFTMEGESSKGALWRFLSGDLKMALMVTTPEEYLKYYQQEGRGVKEWKLNLTPEKKQALWALLDKHTEDWTNLPYDYYHRCCAITIVNIMNELVGRENIHYSEPWPEKFKQTPREIIYHALRGHDEWTQFFICILAGNEVDKDIPYERKFIVPNDVIEAWQKATIDGMPVIDNEPIEVLPSYIQKQDTWCTPLFISIVLTCLALLSLCTVWTEKKWMKVCGAVVDYIVLGLITTIGAAMTYLLFVSDLPCTDWNWLYIAFNPSPAIFWYWRKYWALPYAMMMIAWMIAMLFVPHLLALPSHIILTLAFAIVLLKQSSVLLPVINKK